MFIKQILGLLILSFSVKSFSQQDPVFEKGDLISDISGNYIWKGDYDNDEKADMIFANGINIEAFELDMNFLNHWGASAGFTIDFFAVGDVDGDALVDILAVSNNQIFQWSNGEADTDRTGYINGESFVDSDVIEIQIADVDGDGDMDIITRSNAGTYLEFKQNDNLNFTDNALYTWNGQALDFEMVDFSKNNIKEVVALISESSNYYFSYAYKYDGAYSIFNEYELNSMPANLTIVDVDKDDDQDVLFTDNQHVSIIENFGNANTEFVNFSSQFIKVPHGLTAVNSVHPFDFDSDDDIDFFLSSDDKNIIIRNIEDEYLVFDVTDQISDSFTHTISHDIDSDGYLDILGVGGTELYPYYDKTYFNNVPTVEDQTFTINENLENGTIIGNVNAEDAEEDEIYFKLFAYDSKFSNTFEIDSEGNIYINDSTLIDYELANRIELFVIVQDELSEAKGQSNSGNITVHINDVDEEDLALGRDDDYLSIYPNPGSELIIAIENEYFGKLELEIFDITGKKLLRKQIIKKERRLINEIKSNLENGVYTVKISSNDFEVVNRWIKL